MPFPKRLLVDGEELVLDLRPHPIALARAVLITIAVVVVWIVILTNLPSNRALHQTLVWLVVIGGGVVLVIWPVRDTVRFLTSMFVVTSDRVIHRAGWIAKRSMEIPLNRINDVRFTQGVFERMVGAGSLVIESAGTRGQEVFADIRHPEAMQRTIYERAEAREQRPQTMVAQQPAAGPGEELARLADLRDRGVLTEEEFQAQKAKLLGEQ